MALDSKRLKIFRALALCFRVFCSHCLSRFRSENDLRYIVTVSDVSSCRNVYISFWTYICEIKTKATVNFVVSGDTEHHDDDDAPTVRWYLPHDPLHLSNRSTDYRALRFTVHSSLLSPSLHLYFSLQHIVFPCCNVLHLKPAVFALYKLLYLHRLLYCICILQAAPHLRLCECVPS